MMTLSCPFCGDRNESEFHYGGPARANRAAAAAISSDTEWIDYLTVTANPKGPVREKWWHMQGCGKWMIIERNTVTHRITPREAVSHDPH